MGRRRGMHDGGLGVTQIGSQRYQLGPINELLGCLAATRHLKRQHLAETLLLARR